PSGPPGECAGGQAQAASTAAGDGEPGNDLSWPPVAPIGDPSAGSGRGQLLVLAGQAAMQVSNWDEADQLFASALEHLPDTGHDHAHVEAHRLRAELAYIRYDLRQAQAHLDQAGTAARTCPDRTCRARILITESRLENRLANSGPPRPSPQPTVKTTHGAPTLASTPAGLPGAVRPTPGSPAYYSVNEAAEARHHRDRANSYARAAVDLARDLADTHTLAQALDHAGEHTTALALYTQIGDRWGQAHAEDGLGEVARGRGDLEGAAAHLGTALTLSTQIGDRWGQANAEDGLGHVARARGDLEGAAAHSAAALTLHTQIGNRWGQANAEQGLGHVARARGDLEGAAAHYAAALTLYSEIGMDSQAERVRRDLAKLTRPDQTGDA
ncbi:MAG TPA: hypothetical protein VFP72_21955, partial [Kineosporiaceae bacterium]|nr:hypothetical protein [Kineosporiaceae bacterium]